MNALVPDLAMVPRASTISSRVMPIPLSSTTRRRASAVGREGDAKLDVRSEQARVRERFEAELLASVGRV
jgi:hypothetical protein